MARNIRNLVNKGPKLYRVVEGFLDVGGSLASSVEVLQGVIKNEHNIVHSM